MEDPSDMSVDEEESTMIYVNPEEVKDFSGENDVSGQRSDEESDSAFYFNSEKSTRVTDMPKLEKDEDGDIEM